MAENPADILISVIQNTMKLEGTNLSAVRYLANLAAIYLANAKGRERVGLDPRWARRESESFARAAKKIAKLFTK